MLCCGPGTVCLPAKWLHVFFFIPPSTHAMQPNREMEVCFLSNLWLTVDAKWKNDESLSVPHCPHDNSGAFMQTLFFVFACSLKPQNLGRSCSMLNLQNPSAFANVFSSLLGFSCFLPGLHEWKNLHAHMFPFACATHLSRWHSRVCGIVDSVWALWCSFALSVHCSWLEPCSATQCARNQQVGWWDLC